jgi:hypothetical protein
MSDVVSGQTGSVVPFVRGEPRVAHDEATKAICRAVYQTSGARSPAHTERMAARILEPMGLPVPARQTIWEWSRLEHWAEGADEWLRQDAEGIARQVKLTWLSALVAAGQVTLDIITGVDERDLNERILSMKTSELILRAQERVPALFAYLPPAVVADTDDLSRDEKEARARRGLVQRKNA